MSDPSLHSPLPNSAINFPTAFHFFTHLFLICPKRGHGVIFLKGKWNDFVLCLELPKNRQEDPWRPKVSVNIPNPSIWRATKPCPLSQPHLPYLRFVVPVTGALFAPMASVQSRSKSSSKSRGLQILFSPSPLFTTQWGLPSSKPPSLA